MKYLETTGIETTIFSVDASPTWHLSKTFTSADEALKYYEEILKKHQIRCIIRRHTTTQMNIHEEVNYPKEK